MGKKHARENGFSSVELLVVVVIVSIIGGVGFLVSKNTDKGTQAVKSTATKTAKKDVSTKLTTTDESALKKVTLDAPLCGSDAAVAQAAPASLDLTYTKPAELSVWETYTNGITLKSADFSSKDSGIAGITSGATVGISVSNVCRSNTSIVKDMQQYAYTQAMEPTKLTYIQIGEYYGVRFTHKAGENRNSHDVALLFKGARMYTIDEQFAYATTNPYKTVVDTIVGSVR